jgi:GNAT superfamily N-acetyltransferase
VSRSIDKSCATTSHDLELFPTVAAARYRITEHDVHTLTDDELALDAALNAIAWSEWNPGEPAPPPEQVIASARAIPRRTKLFLASAWSNRGDLVGRAACRIDPEFDATPDLLDAEVFVHPEHRRHGVGRALVDRLVAYGCCEHRARITAWTTSRVPAGADFASSLGARAVTHTNINRLSIAAVDRSQLERWVEDGPRRAPGYDLLGWDGPTPDEHLDAFADIYAVMNDAPLGDLEHNDATFTPARIREWETRSRAMGQEGWTLVAVAPEGVFVGLHTVSWAPWRPTVVGVADTGVRREHRGHALGKWMKAAMTLRIMDDRPAVTEIETGNVDSNAAMLGINTEMGYRLKMSSTTWELRIV